MGRLPVMGSDTVCFSGPSLTLVGGLLTVMATAIGVLFRSLLASKNEQIEHMKNQCGELEKTNDLLSKQNWEAMDALRDFQRLAGSAVEVARARKPR